MLPEPLKAELTKLIIDFEQAPSADELAAGWRPSLKIRWADWFTALQAKLEAGDETPPGWGIIRAMDFDGVSDTPLAQRANHVGRLVDEWKSAV